MNKRASIFYNTTITNYSGNTASENALVISPYGPFKEAIKGLSSPHSNTDFE